MCRISWILGSRIGELLKSHPQLRMTKCWKKGKEQRKEDRIHRECGKEERKEGRQGNNNCDAGLALQKEKEEEEKGSGGRGEEEEEGEK